MNLTEEEVQQLVGAQTMRIFALEKKILMLAHLLADAKNEASEKLDGKDTKRESN